MELSERLVSIVLVTWNSAGFLPRCLDGIRGQTYQPIELLVVDNSSDDGSLAIVRPFAREVIANEMNRGFSAAVNQALRLARGEFVLTLNPDCHLQPEFVERLVSALDEAGEEFGTASGMLVRARGPSIEPTDVIDSLGIRMTRSGRHLDLGQGEPVVDYERIAERDLPPGARLPSGALEIFGASGAAAMYRRVFLEAARVGDEVLDEDFFAYREDADLAWRGRIFGWRALCEPRAVGHHVRRVTPSARRALSADVNMHSVKNRFLLRMKNEGILLALRNAPFELARDLIVAGATLTVERESLPAWSWLFANRRRVLEKRREIQRRRRVSERELARWFR